MRLKKLGAAACIAAALSVVPASSAFAAAVTEDVKWYTGASPGTELTVPESITAEQVGTGTLTTEVSGTPVVLHMTGTKCIGCQIQNNGFGSGHLEFTGVTVEKPEKCATSSTILTKALRFTADWMLGSTNYWKFEPTAGESAKFASFELVGVACALEKEIIPEGSIFFKGANATGTQAVTQQVSSSAEINSTAGGSFHVGTETASLLSTVNFKLSGTKAGTAFGTKPIMTMAVTTDVKWYTGASPGTELTAPATAKSHEIGESTFETLLGGFAVKLHSTNIECSECKIENSGGTAVGEGKLVFTGVTVAEPANCEIAGTITTNKLKVKADYMISSVDYILFEPAAGPTAGFATVSLTGATCPIETTIIPKGTLFVRAQNATGVQAVEQKVNSSAAINTEAGGSFHVGEEPASLMVEAAFELTSGAAFGTH